MFEATSAHLKSLGLTGPSFVIDEGRARANIRAMAGRYLDQTNQPSTRTNGQGERPSHRRLSRILAKILARILAPVWPPFWP